jgi:hypothetical protein
MIQHTMAVLAPYVSPILAQSALPHQLAYSAE